jgi:hypothetical protein
MIFGLDTTYDIATNITVLIGLALLTAIVIWVTHNEKGAIKFNVTYPNENQIKINNKIFDIKKDECKIYIIKNYEYNIGRGGLIGESYGRDYYTEKYNIVIKGKHTKKSFQIAPGTEKDFKDFIYNFDFEQSETRKQNYKVIKDAFNILEEKYK